MEDYDVDCDAILHPEEEPEVVALGDQDIEEVKETIRKADKAYEAQRKKRHEETLKELQGACGLSGKEPTLSYDDELSDACQPDLEKARYNCAFNREVDVFAMWRRLANVKVGRADLEPQVFCPTKDLMDYILMKLHRSFPNLELSWSESTWNPCLEVNKCPTRISMEKIALAYQGLLNITEDLNTQVVICNIVTKKLKELFI